MAIKTLHCLNSKLSGANHMALQDGGSAPADATTGTGWTVGKTAASNYARMAALVTRAASTFAATVQPSGAPDNTLGDCWAVGPLSGAFASANWTLSFRVCGVAATGSQDGQFRVRIWRSASATGSGPTEITATTQVTTAVTNLAAAPGTALTLTFNPGAFSLSNEYLFVQLAWQITGAGSANGCDVIFRVGAGSNIATSDFAPSFAGTLASSLPALSSALSGSETFSGALASADSAPSSALAGAGTFAGTLASAGTAPSDGLSGAQTFAGDLGSTGVAGASALSGEVTAGGTSGDLASSLTAPTDSLAGALAFGGDLASAPPAPASALAGVETFAGGLGSATGAPASALSGGETLSGALASAGQPATSALSGTHTPPGAVGGDIASTLGPPTSALSGTYTPPAVAGDLASTISAPASALAGSVTFAALPVETFTVPARGGSFAVSGGARTVAAPGRDTALGSAAQGRALAVPARRTDFEAGEG